MKSKIALYAACAALAYWVITTQVYRFRHPWMTETELILRSGSALLWKK
jgi:hypothetical protein